MTKIRISALFKIMGNYIFVINCGSSSIKFQLIDPSTEVVYLKGVVENIGCDRCLIKFNEIKINLPKKSYEEVLDEIFKLLDPYKKNLAAIGHRVVHGGEYFSSSTLIDEASLTKIKKCSHLAPLHNPVNILGIEISIKTYPHLPNIAVFDTAFHMTLPEHAYLYALPYEYYLKHKVRKYGFHGTSHRYISIAAKNILPEYRSLIIAHLGNGSSVCAVKDGKSIDTSMGFTPLEGLVMGTRSGDLDPSIIPYLCKKLHLSVDEVLIELNSKSGLLGISEISSDMRLLEEKALEHNVRAKLAIEVFCYRLAKYIASYQVPLGGCDALIFTGGIGENSHYIRSKVVNYLPYFNIDETFHKALKRGQSGIISGKNPPYIAVIATNEELLIAKDTDILRRGL